MITLLGEVDTVICAPRPWTRPSAPLFKPSFTSKTKQTEQFTSCTSVLNSYSQYSSTKCPIVYYTWFTVSTLIVKSVFWNSHAINVFLNTYLQTSERQSVCASVRSITSLIWGGCDRRPIVNQSGFPPLTSRPTSRPHPIGKETTENL